MRGVLILAVLFALALPAGAQVATIPTVQYVAIPIPGAGTFGRPLEMVAEVFKPAGEGPFAIVVYLHGRDGTQAERLAITEAIPRDYLRYWMGKGFAVVAPMRPGYGKTGGNDRESPGHRWEAGGKCTRPDFAKAISAAALAAGAALDWARAQPWVRSGALLLSGNSVGGITTVATASGNPVGVMAYINFAGGIGGNPALSPGKSCDADQLRDLYGTWGKSARLPGLWLYARNDQFWGPDSPRLWHAAFAAGGSPSELVSTAPLSEKDGHDLIFFGRALWHEHVDAFLQRLGYP